MRIFDTFPFDGEFDLLEHRLEETHDLVDAFIIVEAAQTYSGRPKAPVFEENRERVSWAQAKLRYVALDGLGGGQRSPRERAAVQRDAIRLALGDAEDDDAVLLFDADEIASRSLLERLRVHGIDEPRRVLMTRLYEHAYAVSPRSPCCPSDLVPFQAATPHMHPGAWASLDRTWQSSSGVVVPYRALATATAFSLRFGPVNAEPLRDGGRHFSSVDPSTRLERKLKRVFHTEWSGPRDTSPAHLERCRSHGVHRRGWFYTEQPAGRVPADIQRLLRRLGVQPSPFPALRRRRAVRTWAWIRGQDWVPARLVAAVDRHFDRLLPLLLAPLLLADAARQAAASAIRTPRPTISRTNDATSSWHVVRSTS
jgi:beta-1,4-mannosyl-glycoprotein beta-1,4-N-acetylglucosaminyltransferase